MCVYEYRSGTEKVPCTLRYWYRQKMVPRFHGIVVPPNTGRVHALTAKTLQTNQRVCLRCRRVNRAYRQHNASQAGNVRDTTVPLASVGHTLIFCEPCGF